MKKKPSEKSGIIYTFVNLFNAWFNRRQLDSYMCSCIQSFFKTFYFILAYSQLWAFLVSWMVKNLLVMQETWVQSLGWEDPLEKRMAIHSSILVWRIPWTEESGRLQPTGSQIVGDD